MAGWEEMAVKAVIKAAGGAMIGGTLSYLKNRTESMCMQYERLNLKDTYHARERTAIMRAAVALAQAGRLDTSNVKIIMQVLEENENEHKHGLI